MHFDPPIASAPCRYHGPAIYGYWQNQALVVVGVFAYQVYPARRPEHPGFAVAEPAAKFRDYGVSFFHRRYWFTPLARNPPSTATTSPVTNAAASDARNTAAPASSSTLPNRFIGVRIRNSRPRSVPSSSFRFNGVGKTPGAIAFTVTPRGANSIASCLVNIATAALLAP